MTDITERLAYTHKHFPDEYGLMCGEAKAEIERLKAELDRKPEILRQEIDKRVAAETERCAKIVDEMLHYKDSKIAKVIRGQDK